LITNSTYIKISTNIIHLYTESPFLLLLIQKVTQLFSLKYYIAPSKA